MSLKCNHCDKQVDSEGALVQHLKDKHNITDLNEISKTVAKTNDASYKLSSIVIKNKKLLILGLGIIISLLLVALLISTSTRVNAQSVDGIQCTSLEGTVIHIHPHLSIMYNNINITIPSQIGIEYSCLYGLHTHDNSGAIHVESPVVANYTLGEFFDIWNKTVAYSPTIPQRPILATLNNSTITAYVNNATYNGNYRNIQLKDKEQIKLVIVSG